MQLFWLAVMQRTAAERVVEVLALRDVRPVVATGIALTVIANKVCSTGLGGPY